MLEVDDLADAADAAMIGLLDEDTQDLFDEMAPIEKVQYRYLHGDCDDFALALHHATGWPVRTVSSPAGDIHLLNEAPDGRMADASGWTDLDAVSKRYKTAGLRLSKPGGSELCHSRIASDEQMWPVISAMLHIDVEPFENAIRGDLEHYAESIGLECDRASWAQTPDI